MVLDLRDDAQEQQSLTDRARSAQPVRPARRHSGLNHCSRRHSIGARNLEEQWSQWPIVLNECGGQVARAWRVLSKRFRAACRTVAALIDDATGVMV